MNIYIYICTYPDLKHLTVIQTWWHLDFLDETNSHTLAPFQAVSVDGRNPAPVDMENILFPLDFIDSRWIFS